jgi:hypothetical protein
MTVYYSDLLASTAAATQKEAGYMAPARSYAGSLQYGRAVMDFGTTVLTDDDHEAIMMPLQSNTRLVELYVSDTGTGAAATLDGTWGLFRMTAAGGLGTVVDIDLFDLSVNHTGAVAHQDIFDAAALGDVDRGKTLWELATVGAASYTEDPNELWAIVLTMTALTVTVNPDDITLEAYYINS